jgi:hypothetical protein
MCAMPLSPDEALERLKQITIDFSSFCVVHGDVNEADTRAQLIDRVLVEVCGWPELYIKREQHVDRGYIDYTLLMQSRPFIAVEAKREGRPFRLPGSGAHRKLKLNGSLVTDVEVRDAINQVRGYCDDHSIRYAVATNGYTWLVFRAIREDIPWREGSAVVFPSLDYIVANFSEFWNLLSYEAISAGRLDSEFGTSHRPTRELYRVVDRLFNADLPLQRNRLHAQLQPLIRTIFEDIADQDQIEILQSCYVHSKTLKIVAQDLDLVITDSMPRFIANEGGEELRQTAESAGKFDAALARAFERSRGELILLLGGIGSGKTTFLKRYQRTVGAEMLAKRSIWFHVDFLAAPLDPRELEDFVWRSVLDQLRSRYSSPHLETRRNIKRVYHAEIQAIAETALRSLKPNTDHYEEALSPYLEKWQSNISEYVPRLLGLVKPYLFTARGDERQACDREAFA